MYYSIVETYITSAHDTIYRIANMFYFHWYLWKVIYDYNQDVLGDNPYVIPAGVEIKIVDLNTEDMAHTITSGETWVSLARDYYGSERHWVDIAIANDYKHLIEGETCYIPALITTKDLKQAKELRSVCA